jgi:hypothetical protein
MAGNDPEPVVLPSEGMEAVPLAHIPHSTVHQVCGSGFSDFLDPDPYWESGSRIRIQGQES